VVNQSTGLFVWQLKAGLLDLLFVIIELFSLTLTVEML